MVAAHAGEPGQADRDVGGWPIALNECPEPSGRTVRPAAPARTSTSAAAAASTGTATCVGVDVTVPDQLRHHPARGAPHHRP